MLNKAKHIARKKRGLDLASLGLSL